MSEPANPQPIHDEELVAYLDGELDDESTRRVENRLRSDETARKELQRLERAWNMLDSLPRCDADESFTKSTVEMLAVEAEGELNEQVSKRAKRAVWLRGLIALSLMLAGFIGVLLVDRFWPDPNDALLRDLPVVRNLDQYEQVEYIEFLRQLQVDGLFKKDSKKERSDDS